MLHRLPADPVAPPSPQPAPLANFRPMQLDVISLSRRFGAVQALDGVSFGVSAGEIVGLIGPNGAGKSTLLACVAGLDAPDSGAIRIDGAEATAVARRHALFYLPDGIAPWADQPASWVLDYGAALFRAAEPWRAAIAPALGLAPFVSQRVGALSKGQRKRVLLALALLVPRAVTLIDEPFDGLDPRQALALSELFRSARDAGRTFVLSIHAMSEATRTCDRHVLLHDGRVLAAGTLAELVQRAALPADGGLEEVFLALT